jgi:Transposase DDE domain
MRFKSSIQRELDKFVRDISKSDFSIREISKGAFTQARAKLNPWAFKRLNEVAVNTFYAQAPYHTWHNKRLLAVDGTRLILPKHSSIDAEFGTNYYGPKANSPQSIALASVLYDPLNQICIDSEIEGIERFSEIDLLLRHLAYVKQGDLLVLDRFYPSKWLFFLLAAKGVDFCVRMKKDWWKVVENFTNSDLQQTEVSFLLPKKDFEKLAEYKEIIDKEIKCRLIKVVLETGETEVLCTSLLNCEAFKIDEFKDLYNLRWNEEEAYKLLKSRIELERFSGKTSKAVRQDFHAKIFLMTLCAAYAHPIEEKVKTEYKKSEDTTRKHEQKINRTNALATLSDMLLPIFIKKLTNTFLKYFDDIVYKTREIVRKGRKFERIKKQKKPYYMNYKPL